MTTTNSKLLRFKELPLTLSQKIEKKSSLNPTNNIMMVK